MTNCFFGKVIGFNCLVFLILGRSAGGLHPLFLCHENQADLALLCSHAPSAGPALLSSSGNYCHHQQICNGVHWLGSPLFPGVEPFGAN